MKKVFSLKEYVQNLPEKDLNELYDFLSERLPGDLANCLDYFSKNSELDKLLSNTKSSNELYDFIDQVHKAVELRISKKRQDVA